MSRTKRNTKHCNQYGIRNIRSHNYLVELTEAKQQIEEYVGRNTCNRIRNTGRIPTSYDDKPISAISEKFSNFSDGTDSE